MNRRYSVIGFFCGFFLLGTVFVNSVSAGSETKKLYKEAEEKYSQRKVDEAIADLESALEIDSSFKKAEDLLLKILITVSSEYYAEGDYERAFPYINKAYNVAPENAKVRYMYETVSKEVKAKEAEKKAAELEAQKKAEEGRRKPELEAQEKEEELLKRKRQEEEKRERELEAKKETKLWVFHYLS